MAVHKKFAFAIIQKMISFVGDARFFWPENIENFIHIPSMWDSILNTGIGMPAAGTSWITSYLNLTASFTMLGLNWVTITFLFWFLPAVIVSFFSAFSLFNHFFQNRKFAFLAGILYLCNTYFFLILGGGQFGVSMSYALAPFVFLSFIKLFENPKIKVACLSGFLLGVQIMFDPRLVVITFIALFLFFVLQYSVLLHQMKKIIIFSLFAIVTSLLLHSFWLIPLIIFPTSLPRSVSISQNVNFFSFADFSHAISFLHPNWPENLFGKVYFLQPEFLLLPILAFSSLFFIFPKTQSLENTNIKNPGLQIRNKKYYSQILQKYIRMSVLVFLLITCLGVFLSKGTNPPFGFLYQYLYAHMPGFVAFRDPTKWYLLIALSYSILVPFSLLHIEEKVNMVLKQKNIHIRFFSFLLPILFIFYVLFLLRPVLSNTVFRPKNIPQEYIDLKNFLNNDKTFSRSLWIPQWQRFGFFSSNHPAIGRGEIIPENSQAIQKYLKDPRLESQLQELSVKYVILPFDSEGEIFQSDRKYDDKGYRSTYTELKKVSWLREIAHFGKIVIFVVPNAKDHFWTLGSAQIRYSMISPTDYKIQIQNAKKGDKIIFSETYSKYWQMTGDNTMSIASNQYNVYFNSFIIRRSGNYSMEINYLPQKLAQIGLIISLYSLFFLTITFFFTYNKRL